MAIDFQAYRQFLADVEAAEASGREWHCEVFLYGEWSADPPCNCGPGEYQYHVIYDSPPEPPATNPLEGWVNVYPDNNGGHFGHSVHDTKEQAIEACDERNIFRTVRVREVVEEHKLDGLAESVCLQVNDQLRQEVGRLKQVVLNVENALTFGMVEVPIRVVERVQQAIAKHRDATDKLLDGVEAVAEVLANPQPDLIGDIRQGVPVPQSQEEAAEYLMAHVKPLRPTLLNRPQSTPNPLAEPRKPRTWWATPTNESHYKGWCGNIYTNQQAASVEVREILPGEDDRNAIIDKWREWHRAEKVRGDEHLRDLEYEQSKRVEAEQEVERLKLLCQDIDQSRDGWKQRCLMEQGEVGRLQASNATLTAERDVLRAKLDDDTSVWAAAVSLERQLVIAVEYIKAVADGTTDAWMSRHSNEPVCLYPHTGARQCLELIRAANAEHQVSKPSVKPLVTLDSVPDILSEIISDVKKNLLKGQNNESDV